MVFLMMNTRCSKHVEDTKKLTETLIWKSCILLVRLRKSNLLGYPIGLILLEATVFTETSVAFHQSTRPNIPVLESSRQALLHVVSGFVPGVSDCKKPAESPYRLQCTLNRECYTVNVSTGQLKCDGTRAETRFRLSAKRTSPFKSAGGVSSFDYWQPRCAHQR